MPRLGPLVVAGLAAPALAHGWTGPVHERVAVYALKLMPPALRVQLARNQAALIEGVGEPEREDGPEAHALAADGSGGTLDRRVAAEVGGAITLVRERGSFADLARAFGRISHLAADATFPLNTSDADAREPRIYADYAAYAQTKLGRFPPVFDGWAVLAGAFEPGAYVRELAERSNQAYPIVVRGYFPTAGGAMRRSSGFDDRGPEFGVTQLAFVRAVSATAHLWLHAWREAHGDLAGTPHFPAVTRAAHVEAAPRAAQRP